MQVVVKPEEPEVEVEESKSSGDSKSDGKEEQKPDEYDYPCIKMPKIQLIISKECKVSISDPKIQDDGFFSQNYLDFLVKTSGINKEVRRRDKDFNDLRDYLAKQYPYVLVPPCPIQKKLKKTDDTAFLAKRAYLLKRFINKILDNEIL